LVFSAAQTIPFPLGNCWITLVPTGLPDPERKLRLAHLREEITAEQGAMDALFEEQRNEPPGVSAYVESIRTDNRTNGLAITPQTLPPVWRGEKMDHDLAQLGMQSRE
jgi:hypothetical protein